MLKHILKCKCGAKMNNFSAPAAVFKGVMIQKVMIRHSLNRQVFSQSATLKLLCELTFFWADRKSDRCPDRNVSVEVSKEPLSLWYLFENDSTGATPADVAQIHAHAANPLMLHKMFCPSILWWFENEGCGDESLPVSNYYSTENYIYILVWHKYSILKCFSVWGSPVK